MYTERNDRLYFTQISCVMFFILVLGVLYVVAMTTCIAATVHHFGNGMWSSVEYIKLQYCLRLVLCLFADYLYRKYIYFYNIFAKLIISNDLYYIPILREESFIGQNAWKWVNLTIKTGLNFWLKRSVKPTQFFLPVWLLFISPY